MRVRRRRSKEKARTIRFIEPGRWCDLKIEPHTTKQVQVKKEKRKIMHERLRMADLGACVHFFFLLLFHLSLSPNFLSNPLHHSFIHYYPSTHSTSFQILKREGQNLSVHLFLSLFLSHLCLLKSAFIHLVCQQQSTK